MKNFEYHNNKKWKKVKEKPDSSVWQAQLKHNAT
jgi:hypothetical protein